MSWCCSADWLYFDTCENKRRGWRGLWFPSQDDEVARLMSRCFGLTTCEIPLLPRSPPADAAHHVRHFNERCPHFSGIQFLPMMKWWSEAPGPASWQPIIESPQIEKTRQLPLGWRCSACKSSTCWYSHLAAEKRPYLVIMLMYA